MSGWMSPKLIINVENYELTQYGIISIQLANIIGVNNNALLPHHHRWLLRCCVLLFKGDTQWTRIEKPLRLHSRCRHRSPLPSLEWKTIFLRQHQHLIWLQREMSSNHTRYYVYSDMHDALSPVNCHNSIIQIGQQRNLNNIMRGCCVCLLCFETATAAAAASCPKIKLTPELMLNCRASLNYLLHSSRLYYIPPIKRAGEEETQLWNIVIIHILRDYDSIYFSLRIHNLASPIPARIGKWQQQQQQQEGWPFERTRLNISMEVIPQFHLSGLFSYPKNDPPVCAWLTSPLNPNL